MRFISLFPALWPGVIGGPQASAQTRGQDAPCNVALEEPNTATWRLVQASGFTFCVPPDWRPAGGGNRTNAKRWTRGLNVIAWGTGAPRRPVAQGYEIARVTPGQPIPQITTPCTPRRSNESIDHRLAEVFDTDCGDKHHTGANWHDPRIYFQGEAGDAAGAQLQLVVFRTVRFTSP